MAEFLFPDDLKHGQTVNVCLYTFDSRAIMFEATVVVENNGRISLASDCAAANGNGTLCKGRSYSWSLRPGAAGYISTGVLFILPGKSNIKGLSIIQMMLAAIRLVNLNPVSWVANEFKGWLPGIIESMVDLKRRSETQ